MIHCFTKPKNNSTIDCNFILTSDILKYERVVIIKLEHTLQQRNRKQINQAYITPFTTQLLKYLLE